MQELGSRIWHWTRFFSGYRLVNVKRLHQLPERMHLRRLLSHFGVDCIFDVGANEGQYARMLRRHAKFRGRIISFEPIPALAERLRAEAAHDPLWTIEEVALSDATGEQQLNIMRDSQFSSLSQPLHSETDLFEVLNEVVDTVTVKTETLNDAYARLHGEYGFSTPFLKMDTQGSNETIVREEGHVLGRFIGMQSELSVKRIYESSIEFRESLDLYGALGFELSAIVPNNEGHFPALVEFDGIFVRRDLIHRSQPPTV